jgi:predicted dehydrogenase
MIYSILEKARVQVWFQRAPVKRNFSVGGMMISRRAFLGGVVSGATGMAIGATAKSYAQIAGANERINFALIGTGSRSHGHLAGLKANSDLSRVVQICDVDSEILGRYAGSAEQTLGYRPAATSDFRKILDSKDVDVITIATPDHWHAPMAILGLKAGKHVYVEKPSSHNPREGELLVLAQKKYDKLVQVGTQRRSSTSTIKIIKEIQDGRIGRVYYGKAWYSDTRATMGTGQVAPVPKNLNWDLWQGPAPRSEYKNNIHPYNWHWLRRYGTGEALNNGTHEIDLCRWALGVGYPERVAAQGGRYQFKDDWEFYDTLVVSFAYPDKMICWESKSDQGMMCYGRNRGVLIQGTEGSVIIDHEGFEVFDWQGNKTASEGKIEEGSTVIDHTGVDELTNAHFRNLIQGILKGEALHSPVEEINTSITSLQLANISWMVNRELRLDTQSGHILNDPDAMRLWSREYEKGWEVTV